MSREEVSALATVREWLGGILDGFASENDLRRALVIAEILTPMQRWLRRPFRRTPERVAALRNYVGVIGLANVTSRVWAFVARPTMT